MARIPVYEQQIAPSASRGNIRAGNAVVDLGGVARGMDQVAGALENRDQIAFALEKQRIEDEGRIWAAKATSEFDLSMAEHLKNRQTAAEPGAKGFWKSYLDDYDKVASEAVKNAPSKYAAGIMQAHTLKSRELYGKSAIAWEDRERERKENADFEDGVNTSAQLVQANPALFEQEMGKWAGTAAGTAATPEVKEKRRDFAKNTLAMATIKGWVDQNPQVAGDVLQAWQKGVEPGDQPMFDVNIGGKKARLPLGMLDPKQQQEIMAYVGQKEREFKTETMANTFIGAARAAVAGAGLIGGETVNIATAKANALQAAEATLGKLDEVERLQLEGYVEKLATDRQQEVRVRRDASMASLFNQLEQNGGDYQAVLAANPWVSGQSAEFRMRLNDYAGKVATGGTRETDWQAYNMLVEDPALLKSTNLDAMKDKFNSSEFVQLKKLQESLVNDTPEQEVRSTTSLLNQMLAEAGYKRNEKVQGRFFSLLQESVDQELAATGKKKLPQARVKELAADLLVKDVTSKGILFDTEKRGVAIEVPANERVKIEAALREAGMPVNDYNVLQAYRNKLRKMNQ